MYKMFSWKKKLKIKGTFMTDNSVIYDSNYIPLTIDDIKEGVEVMTHLGKTKILKLVKFLYSGEIHCLDNLKITNEIPSVTSFELKKYSGYVYNLILENDGLIMAPVYDFYIHIPSYGYENTIQRKEIIERQSSFVVYLRK